MVSALRRTKDEQQSGSSDWEVVSVPSLQLELYPRRIVSDDKSVKFDEGVETLKSIEELPDGRTWLLIQRGDEDHVMFWSPCTGERLMMPVELVDQVRTGLLLARSSGYMVTSTGLMLDYEEQVLYASSYAWLENGNMVTWSFSSGAGEWEVTSILDKEEQEQGEAEVDEFQVEELGKMYHVINHFNPKLKASKSLPSPAGVGVHLEEREWWHWYHGSLYNLGCDTQSRSGNLLVSRWDANSNSWTRVASHAIYSHGVVREAGEFVSLRGGARYLSATQGSSEHMCWGRFLVVYDLEEDKWHYKTIQADHRSGCTLVLACNRGYTGHALLDAAFSAVWLQDPCHLPPLPV